MSEPERQQLAAVIAAIRLVHHGHPHGPAQVLDEDRAVADGLLAEGWSPRPQTDAIAEFRVVFDGAPNNGAKPGRLLRVEDGDGNAIDTMGMYEPLPGNVWVLRLC